LNISKESYGKMVKRQSVPSPKIRDFIFAFLIGGGICVLGQLILELCKNCGLEDKVAETIVPISLITIAAFLTGFKIFEKIAKVGGAGTLVPITGFANAVVSPAIEFRNEGYILGVGAKIFTVAGPVILYGTVASVIYGILYWIFEKV